jgi:hypothetical protein
METYARCADVFHCEKPESVLTDAKYVTIGWRVVRYPLPGRISYNGRKVELPRHLIFPTHMFDIGHPTWWSPGEKGWPLPGEEFEEHVVTNAFRMNDCTVYIHKRWTDPEGKLYFTPNFMACRSGCYCLPKKWQAFARKCLFPLFAECCEAPMEQSNRGYVCLDCGSIRKGVYKENYKEEEPCPKT